MQQLDLLEYSEGCAKCNHFLPSGEYQGVKIGTCIGNNIAYELVKGDEGINCIGFTKDNRNA